MRCFLFTLLLFVAVGQTRLSAGDNLENLLNQQYRGHTYTLRRPVAASRQYYDSQGNLTSQSDPGPWTVYGRMLVVKIRFLDANKIVVGGFRIGMRFDPQSQMLAPFGIREEVILVISLLDPLSSAEQFRAILSRIFAFTKEDFVASVPRHWRKYLEQNLVLYSNDGQQIAFKPSPSAAPGSKEPEILPPDVYRVGNGVSAPKPRYTPDPEYSEAAKKLQWQGTTVLNIIVDKAGDPKNIQVVRPLGLGLDDTAADKVSTWKFSPATRNGEPVAVEISVEVEFHFSD